MSQGRRFLLTLMVMSVCAFSLFAQTTTDAAKEKRDEETLELVGRPKGQRPDIIVLEPRFSQPLATYAKRFEQFMKHGTRLPSSGLTMAAFENGSMAQLLKKAEYNLYPLTDIRLEDACHHLNAILEMRRLQRLLKKTDAPLSPLCFLLSIEASPEAFLAHVEPLLESNALVFVIPPQDYTLPLLVVWDRFVWPNHLVEYPVKPTQWIPTLAEITGIYPPAEIIAPSILPSLTGVGYQRPNEISPRHSNTNRRFVEVHTYEDFGELRVKEFPWMPDPEALIPSNRQFFDGTLPVPYGSLRLKTVNHPQFLVIRSSLKHYSLSLPSSVSLLIRVNGQPVYSRWDAEEAHTWHLNSPETMGVSFYVWIPENVDPSAVLKQFEAPEEEHADSTLK